jgi:Kyanoviridae endonuclease
MYVYRATLRRVVDGDTIDVDIDLGLKVHVHARLRLLGVNTPEIYGKPKASEEYKEGLRAKELVEAWFARNTEVIVKTQKDRTGKYGRWLAHVFPKNLDAADSLNVVLRKEGWGSAS